MSPSATGRAIGKLLRQGERLIDWIRIVDAFQIKSRCPLASARGRFRREAVNFPPPDLVKLFRTPEVSLRMNPVRGNARSAAS